MIAYHAKSSTTGKLLRTLLSCPLKKTQRRARLDVLLRWGSSEVFSSTTARLELNTAEAVANASNKARMMGLLASAGDIPLPRMAGRNISLDEIKDETGNYYIRSNAGVVRYGNDFNHNTDAYATQPIPNKRREYRVHVFNGKIVAIYEKIPHSLAENGTRPALFKSHNCHFSLVDPQRSRCDNVGQGIAIRAVAALGLLFGGVDLVRTREGEFIVLEVNSAPGLNNTNAQRWIEHIREYINENLPVRSQR